MNEEITITIHGWETSESNPETIVDDMKKYVTAVFDWTEEIPDPENPLEMIPNPKDYKTIIFNEKPMNDFFNWLKDHRTKESSKSIEANVETMKDQTTVTAE